MRRPALIMLAVTVLLGNLTFAGPALAKGNNNVFVGRIDHVSSNNIKVTDPRNGQSLSFVILPKFKDIWSDDGKTTYQMSFLHPGTPVKVLYDQKVLGMRHANKIIVLKRL